MPQYVEYGPDQYMDPNGSSLMGYVTATYGELVGLFGEPNCPPGDKTWNSWDISFTVFEDDEGEDHQDIYASIYEGYISQTPIKPILNKNLRSRPSF